MIREEIKTFPDQYDANLRLVSSAYRLRVIWARITGTNCWIAVLAKERHPDHGGSHDAMAELNRARDEALQEIAR